MPTSTRLKTLLVPLVAAGAALLLSGCIQVAAPQDTTEPSTGTDETEETTAPTDDGTTTDVFALSIGDCILEPGSDETVTETTVVDCDAEHSYEVFDESTVDDGDYPGDDAISAQAETDCAAAFEPFVGLSYQESQYLISYLTPTSGSWEQGDRVISCLIADPSGSNTGSLAGVNQ